jgi:RNA polymerase sigma-70 factor (ECF subfamily)
MALTEIDSHLLKRCLADEPGAWKDFVDRFIGLFVHVINHSAHARSMTLSEDDVDDLCAEVFLALLDDNFAILRRFQGKSSLATYLAVVARRIVVREMVRRRMSQAFGHVNAHHASLSQAGAESSRELQSVVEDREEVQRMLEDLPPSEAEIVRQFHLEGKSYREISLQLGIPENSIGPTLSRVRLKIRQGNVQP